MFLRMKVWQDGDDSEQIADEVTAGIAIDPLKPGYKHILIQPQPGGGLSSVRVSHQTMYGTVSSAWTYDGNSFDLAVEVPANTTATVKLPKTKIANVTENGHSIATGNGIVSSRQDGDAVVVEVGSGQYKFACAIASKN